MSHSPTSIGPIRDTRPDFKVTIARSKSELRAAQTLRYQVFVQELGARGAMVDHTATLEQDRFDPYCDHLLVHDQTSGRLAGVYRLLRTDQATAAGGFYSETEYDLSVLTSGGKILLELGRSCLHRDFRGTTALFHLWAALAEYIRDHHIEILFGVASFHGTEPRRLAAPLSYLHHNHLAQPDLRVTAQKAHCHRMDMISPGDIDRVKAMAALPSLIKAYLRLGGSVGEGAFVDHSFNTTDVCLVMAANKIPPRQTRIYAGSLRR